jgi:hypothetical protein
MANSQSSSCIVSDIARFATFALLPRCRLYFLGPRSFPCKKEEIIVGLYKAVYAHKKASVYNVHDKRVKQTSERNTFLQLSK